MSFEEGSTILKSVTLDASGQATFTTSTLALGSDAITAVYAGSGNFLASSSAPLTQVVKPLPLQATTTHVASSIIISDPRRGRHFRGDRRPGLGHRHAHRHRHVLNRRSGATLVDLQVLGGQDEAFLPPITDLSVGPHTITATYSGNPSFGGSAGMPRRRRSMR